VLREKKKSDAKAGRDKTREYIQGKLNSARWLIQTIEQRRRTMIKVMNCIIREQREFFDKGIAFLRPLTLAAGGAADRHARVDREPRLQRQVRADAARRVRAQVLLLERTRDRGRRGRLGARPRRTSSRPDRRGGQEEPLSDQRIAELLHEKGLRIARRTVAKYREQLSILPARFRRRVRDPTHTAPHEPARPRRTHGARRG
jgi:RNA polymerase sigma-54 factor